MNKKILFIKGTNKANTFHALMAKSIGAHEFSTNFNYLSPKNKNKLKYDTNVSKGFRALKIALTLPRGYDIYLSETAFVIPVIAKLLGRIPKSSIIINISADPVLYDITHSRKFRFFIKIQKVLLKYVDGFVLIGNWGFLLDQLGNHKPRIEISAGSADLTYSELLKLKIDKPKMNHNIIFVGTIDENSPDRMRYKGADILLSAFRIVKKEFPDSKLYLTGYSSISNSNPDIIQTGWKTGKNFAKLFNEVSIAVNVGRGDTFPVGTIEAMLAGIPTIVSEVTGTSFIIKSVDERFITPIQPAETASKIIDYFKLPDTQKIRLSQKFRSAAKPYKASRMVANFKVQWDDLVKQISPEKYN